MINVNKNKAATVAAKVQDAFSTYDIAYRSALLLLTSFLALLWQIFRGGIGDEFIAVRASTGWWSHEEVENGLPYGRHGRLWRWPPGSFFSVPLL